MDCLFTALTCEDVLEESQCTIILLDSSFSMRGEPFEAAKKTIRSFVAGKISLYIIDMVTGLP